MTMSVAPAGCLPVVAPGPSAGARPILAELISRQRPLALYGLGALLLSLPALALGQLDHRTLHGVGVWDKPMKFLVAVGLFALTAAWLFGCVRPEQRGSGRLRWTVRTLIATSGFELAWISWQGAWGLDSHFNMSSTFFASMFAVMGVSAVLLVGTLLPLAWEIARRPAAGLAPEFVASVVAGLVLSSVLGLATGGSMSAHMSHSVGASGGHVPLFGWNRLGGDLRIAHFLAIHAEQAIPILGVMVGRLATGLRRPVLAAGTLAYVALTVATLMQAVSGQALLPS